MRMRARMHEIEQLARRGARMHVRQTCARTGDDAGWH